MTLRLLYISGLPPSYWADAVIHAVYLKNRMWHATLKTTPYQLYYGVSPNLSHIRVFGSRVYAKIPGKRPAKLDKHVYLGIFLGYGSTAKHIKYIDINTGRLKRASHVTFDEGHYTSTKRPPGAQLLYDIGLTSFTIDQTPDTPTDDRNLIAAYPQLPKVFHPKCHLK